MTNTHFDKQFISSQKQKLEAEKAKLEAELTRSGKKVGPGEGDYAPTYQDYGTDEESNAAEYAQFETNTAIEKGQEDELGRVLRALDRIAKGVYGLDINTGLPINRKRLEVFPAAETDI